MAALCYRFNVLYARCHFGLDFGTSGCAVMDELPMVWHPGDGIDLGLDLVRGQVKDAKHRDSALFTAPPAEPVNHMHVLGLAANLGLTHRRRTSIQVYVRGSNLTDTILRIPTRGGVTTKSFASDTRGRTFGLEVSR